MQEMTKICKSFRINALISALMRYTVNPGKKLAPFKI